MKKQLRTTISVIAIALLGWTATACAASRPRTPAAPATDATPTSSTSAETPVPTVALRPDDPTPTDIVIDPDIVVVVTATTLPTLVPTDAPSPTSVPTPPPLPTTCAPSLTTSNTDNLRAGPGTNYGVLAELVQGTRAQVVARSADGTWYEVITDQSQGWVSASYAQAQCVGNVPIVQVPLPVPTGTAVPSGPTPQPGINFWVDSPSISNGQCTTVRWSVDNVQDVFFNDGSDDGNVAGHGSRTVCPDVTTSYGLTVILNNGQSVAQSLTVTVTGPQPTAPPAPQNRVINFTADNTIIVAGGCVNFQWSVFGDVAGLNLDVGTINSPEPTIGSLQYCPPQTTVVQLFVTWADGSTDSRTLTLQVIQPQPPPPPPLGPTSIPLPPTAAP